MTGEARHELKTLLCALVTWLRPPSLRRHAPGRGVRFLRDVDEANDAPEGLKAVGRESRSSPTRVIRRRVSFTAHSKASENCQHGLQCQEIRIGGDMVNA